MTIQSSRTPLTIYFNRTYATNVHVIDLMRDNPDGRAVKVIATHSDPSSPMLHASDVAAAEPDADATLRGLPVPPHRVITTAQALLDAYDEMSFAYGQICLKPVTGAGAEGFRILDHRAPLLADILGPLSPTVSVRAVAEAIDCAAAAGRSIPPLLMLPYLPGPELSIDLLADRDGITIASVGRSKSCRQRAIVLDQTAQDVAEVLVRAHRLSYVSNTQLRNWQAPQDAEPVPYLLEVNTRMSAGLFQTALAGVNLAWAAVRMVLGQDPSVGQTRHDIRYTTVPALRPQHGARSVRATAHHH